MLLLISRQPHEYTPIVGLNVSPVDENINRLLNVNMVPDAGSLDVRAFNLSQHIVNIIETRRAELEAHRINHAAWLKRFKEELNDEERDRYLKEGYLEGFPQEPNAPEQYDGVLIAESVPNYLTPALTSYLRAANINIFFDYNRVIGVAVKDEMVYDEQTGIAKTVLKEVPDTNNPEHDPHVIWRYKV